MYKSLSLNVSALNKVFFVCAFLLFNTKQLAFSAETPEAFLLDRAALSGLGLEIDKSGGMSSKELYRGKQIAIEMQSWVSGDWRVDKGESDRFIYVVNGRAMLTPDASESITFETGDFFVVPKGFKGKWHVEANKYYQQLNVTPVRISNTEASEITLPFLVDRNILSGLNLTKKEWPLDSSREMYAAHLYKGPELMVAVVAAGPASTDFEKPTSIDELVYVANGSAALTAKDSDTSTFYSRDFFVVPKGFIGNWTNTGNNLYRELIVVPSGRAK